MTRVTRWMPGTVRQFFDPTGGTFVHDLTCLVPEKLYWLVYEAGSSPGAGRLLRFKRRQDALHLRFLDCLSGIVKTYLLDRVSAVYVWEAPLPVPEDLD